MDARSSRTNSTASRGREGQHIGRQFSLRRFDGPQRAIRCAMAIRDAVHALGIEGAPPGLHTGECEIRGGGTSGGIGVHIGRGG